MMLYMLLFVSVALTCALFLTRQMLLGFPAVMFWAIAGGQAYVLSTAVWDIYYFTFFACMGMTIFSALAMFALRTKKEEKQEGEPFIDEEKDTTKYIDEGAPEPDELERIEKEGMRGGTKRVQQRVKERAERRRVEGVKKHRLDHFTH